MTPQPCLSRACPPPCWWGVHPTPPVVPLVMLSNHFPRFYLLIRRATPGEHAQARPIGLIPSGPKSPFDLNPRGFPEGLPAQTGPLPPPWRRAQRRCACSLLTPSAGLQPPPCRLCLQIHVLPSAAPSPCWNCPCPMRTAAATHLRRRHRCRPVFSESPRPHHLCCLPSDCTPPATAPLPTFSCVYRFAAALASITRRPLLPLTFLPRPLSETCCLRWWMCRWSRRCCLSSQLQRPPTLLPLVLPDVLPLLRSVVTPLSLFRAPPSVPCTANSARKCDGFADSFCTAMQKCSISPSPGVRGSKAPWFLHWNHNM